MGLTSAAIKAIKAGVKDFKPSQIKNPIKEGIGWTWWIGSEGAANALEALGNRTYVKAAHKFVNDAGISDVDIERAAGVSAARAFDKTPYEGSSDLAPYYEMSTQDLESEIEEMRRDPDYLRDEDLIAELDRILNFRLTKKVEDNDPMLGAFRAGQSIIGGVDHKLPNTNYQQPEAPLPPPDELLGMRNK